MKTHGIRRWFALALAVALLVAPGVGFSQTSYYYWWQVTDERGEPFTGENVSCSVYRPNTHGAAVLHTASTLASGGTSPQFSDVNGKVHFYASYNSPVDVKCHYRFGGSAQINDFRVTDHKGIIPRQSGALISKFSITAAARSVSSSITLLTNHVLESPSGSLS